MNKLKEMGNSWGKWLGTIINKNTRQIMTLIGIMLLLLSLIFSLFRVASGLTSTLLLISTILLIPRLLIAIYDGTIVDNSQGRS